MGFIMGKSSQKEQKKANNILQVFAKVQHYPYSISNEELKKLEKKIINYYKKGDEKVKGMILFFINEKLSDVHALREFINTKNTKAPQSKILGDALNFFHSIDGQFFLLSLLKKFDDELSLKLLTHYTSKYLAQPGRFYNIFAEKCIDLLGESRNIYALKFLLSLSEISSIESSVYDTVLHNLQNWKNKIDKIKLDKREKKKLKQRILAMFKTSHKPDYYS